MTQAQKKYQLSYKDHQKLKSLLKREPNTLEVVLALALWNEHCSYRSSRKHLKKFQFPTQKKISGLGEQAGILDLGEGEKICFKMESHNHPSYIIPYHGSATAVGGILRDIFAMNARPIALADYLCFADNTLESNPTIQKEHAYRVNGVVKGIADYGNCIGVPTVTGHTEFSDRYSGNILVNAMALGYLGSKDNVMSSKAQGVGNYVVYVGSSTGRDGILGADMASQSFEKDNSQAKPTVQIGDPFLGKQLMEACLLAMKKNWVLACQDMGAAGLTCSSFEMSDKANLGLSLHLDKVPLRDKNLQPEEILLSESQERMLFICKPTDYKKLEELFKSQHLEISCLGEVLATPQIELFWHGKQILKVDPKLFTSHSPIEDRLYTFPTPVKRVSIKELKQSSSQKQVQNTSADINELLLKMLSSSQGRSRQFIYKQYDQRVGTRTVKDSTYPLAIIKLPESGRELAIAMGCRPYLMEWDNEQGAKDAIYYPSLQLVLRGFEPLAVTDCLNFGNPEKKEVMGEFVQCVEQIASACKTLDTPIVSGNVSFYNESEGRNIISTPSIAMVGLKTNSHKIPTSGFCLPKQKVYLLYSHQFYFEGIAQTLNQSLTKPTAYGGLQDPLMKIFISQIYKLSQKNLFESTRLVGKFGLAYSLARMVLEQGVGFSLREDFPLPLTQERLYEGIVCVKPEQEEVFKKEISKLAINSYYMGETQKESSLKLDKQSLSYKQMQEKYCKNWQDLSL